MPGKVLGTLPLVWIARKHFAFNANQPLPLVVFGPWCRIRQAALDALDRAGIAWRIAFTSPSLPGLMAAVKAGLGVTVRTPEGLWPELAVLDSSCGLPDLGLVDVTLHEADVRPAPEVQALKEMVAGSLASLVARVAHDVPELCATSEGELRLRSRSLVRAGMNNLL
jgi:DNA-binding transcriptional LysR family regulator